MQDLIKTHLGAPQFERIEKKAKERGITDIWEVAIDRARGELGEKAAEAAIVERAAVRAQQRAGVIPRAKVEEPSPAPAAPAPVEPEAAPAVPTPEEPATTGKPPKKKN